MNRYKVGPISIIINLFLSAVEQHQIQIEQLTTIMQWIRIGLAKASSEYHHITSDQQLDVYDTDRTIIIMK